MTHSPDEFEPPLPRRTMQHLEQVPAIPDHLEDEIVRRLHARRVLGRHRSRGNWTVVAIAAGISFAAGSLLGRFGPSTPATTIEVAGQSVVVQAEPDAPTVMLIRGALETAIVKAPLVNRSVPAPRASTWF